MLVITGTIAAIIFCLSSIFYLLFLSVEKQDRSDRSFNDIRDIIDKMREDRMRKDKISEKMIDKLEENNYKINKSEIDKLNDIIK